MTKRIEHRDENGLLHHDSEPAVVNDNGSQWWFQHGKEHRDNDLPASIFADGTQCWYQYDKRHRTNGPAKIDSFYGNYYWFVNGHQLKHGILFNHSIYSCFPKELIGSPIFDFLRYILTDPVKDKLDAEDTLITY